MDDEFHGNLIERQCQRDRYEKPDQWQTEKHAGINNVTVGIFHRSQKIPTTTRLVQQESHGDQNKGQFKAKPSLAACFPEP